MAVRQDEDIIQKDFILSVQRHIERLHSRVDQNVEKMNEDKDDLVKLYFWIQDLYKKLNFIVTVPTLPLNRDRETIFVQQPRFKI